MRNGLITLVSLIGIIPAFADNDPGKVVTSQAYVDREVADKQAKIPAQSGDYVVVYPNSAGSDTEHDEAGEINARHISTTLTTGNGVAGTDLPTVGAVNAGLAGKQQKLSGTSGDLVTYGGAAGSVGSKKVYDSASAYSNQTTALVQAQHVNAAVADGFDSHITCHEYAHDGSGICLLYEINPMNGTYVPQPASGSGN